MRFREKAFFQKKIAIAYCYDVLALNPKNQDTYIKNQAMCFIKKNAHILMTMVCCFGSISPATALLTNFNDLVSGSSINGQGGWTVVDQHGTNGELFDEEVVSIGSGQNVWRMSNAVSSGTYSNQPYASNSAQIAGETGATRYNDVSPVPGSTGPATTPYFHASWDFTSATGGAQGSVSEPLSLGISPISRYSTHRMSYLAIEDDGSDGFSLTFAEATSSSFPVTEIASNLAYDEWHTIDIFVEFVDGVTEVEGVTYSNDIVHVLLNETLIHTGTTWEGYYTGNSLSDPNAVDTLLFRSSSGNTSTSGNGLYFDNVYTGNEVIPEPSTYAFVLAALAGIAVWVRRKA